jgi:hypothetical protein
MNSVVA